MTYYTIPAEIKDQLTFQFLKDFRDKTIDIFKENDRRSGREPHEYEKETFWSWWLT